MAFTKKSLLFTPNATTIAAMEEADKGELSSFESVEPLMADLNNEEIKSERKAGTLQGKLSSSFFDALPEDELNAWE